jgi:hypothetical protein
MNARKSVLLNDTVHWKVLESSVVGEGNVNMGPCWIDTDRVTTKVVEAKPVQVPS